MGATARDLAGLAWFVGRLRQDTPGANRWDRPGVEAVLAKWEGRDLRTCLERLRHAADPTAKTPEALNRPWVPEPVGPQPARPPRVDEACHGCNRHLDRCICETAPTLARPVPSATAADHAAQLRAEKQAATADHCSHGVPPSHCVDHRDPPVAVDVPPLPARDARAEALALVHPLARPRDPGEPVDAVPTYHRTVDHGRVRAAMYRFRPGQPLTWRDS